jgi:NhaC family Na+:H+ antiporter
MFEAAIPLLSLLIFIGIGMKIGVGIELVMILATVVTIIIAKRNNVSFSELMDFFCEKMKTITPVLLILICIGMVVGSWMLSGTVPLIIYYGLKVLDPRFVVVTSFILTGIISLFTGTSWGSAATAGVACIGIAQSLGIPLAPVAGAIISGAFIGDKLSPVSDTTNMSALTAGISVFDHIRSMIPNTIFAAGIALVGYTILGFMTTPADGGITPEVLKIISDLESIYNFNILIMLIPAIIIFGGAHLKLSPVILMTTSAIAAGIIGVVINGFSVESMYIALTKGFNVEMIAEIGLDPSSISEGILPLLNRGGMYKMMSGAFLITVLATVFGAFMERVGCLDKLLGGLHKLIKGPRSLINTTFVSGALFHAGTSGGTFGILTIGNLFK